MFNTSRNERAMLYIYHDDGSQEQASLQDVPTREEMHKLMVEKGFLRMPLEEIIAVKEINYPIQREQDRKRHQENIEMRKRRERLEAENRAREEVWSSPAETKNLEPQNNSTSGAAKNTSQSSPDSTLARLRRLRSARKI